MRHHLSRTGAAIGLPGGVLAALGYVGILEGERGNPSLLVLAVLFFVVGIPSFLRWMRTL